MAGDFDQRGQRQRSWGIEITDILVQLAGALEELAPERWDEPSLCDGWRVRDVVGHILWRVGNSFPQMLRSAGPRIARTPNPFELMDELSLEAARASPAELVRQLRRVAARKLAGDGRLGITELSETLVHAFDITQPLRIALAIEPRVSFAVAASRARALPVQLSAVLANRTLVARDAGWSIGSGPAAAGTAEAIVLYLFGRRALPH